MQLLIPCYLGVFMCEYLNFSPLIWAGAYLDREKKKKKQQKLYSWNRMPHRMICVKFNKILNTLAAKQVNIKRFIKRGGENLKNKHNLLFLQWFLLRFFTSLFLCQSIIIHSCGFDKFYDDI